MRTTAPQMFPLAVQNSRVFQVGMDVNVNGHLYRIEGLDDRTNTLLVYPIGLRKERREAIRAIMKTTKRPEAVA